MGSFEAGSSIGKNIVYVHNRFEHFNNTISKMSISSEMTRVITDVKNKIMRRTNEMLKNIVAEEEKYLSILGVKSKKEYFKIYENYKDTNPDKLTEVLYYLTDFSPEKVKELNKIMSRRFPTEKFNSTEEKINRLYNDQKNENAQYRKAAEDFFNGLIYEYEIINQAGADQATLAALQRRQNTFRKANAKLGITENPKNVKEAISVAANLRASDGYGLSLEALAGLMMVKFNNFAYTKTTGSAEPLKQSNLKVVGDGKKEKIKTTDATFTIAEINVGVDVKSNRVQYNKSTQQLKFGHEILSAFLLGKGGFIGKQGFKQITSKDEDLYKQMVYLLVNSTVFKEEGAKVSIVNDVTIGIKALFILGGLIDFLLTYIETAINPTRNQILLFLGPSVGFTSDFLKNTARIIKGYQPNNANIYGMTYNILEKTAKKIPSSLKEELLKNKLKYVREAGGSITYENLFNKGDVKQKMKEITGMALQKSMQLNFKIPLSTMLKSK